MRIVIDLQGAQTESRYRGIGTYTLGLVDALVRNPQGHEIIVVLSGLYPDSVAELRTRFSAMLPSEQIKVWHGPDFVSHRADAVAARQVSIELLRRTNASLLPDDHIAAWHGQDHITDKHNCIEARRHTAETLREAFLASLNPDVIHVMSLFEGYSDEGVTSIGRLPSSAPVSVSLYDLIPMLNPEKYLDPDPSYAAYYREKSEHLTRADLLLTISEHSKQEASRALGHSGQDAINIGCACDEQFKANAVQPEAAKQHLAELGISDDFILYTGGADERKNLESLIQAYAALPQNIIDDCQLVLAGRIPDYRLTELQQTFTATGIDPDRLLFTGYVSNDQLLTLYSTCELFVFPSLHEGFGLPALEAMSCGAAVICSNTTSLPEVVEREDATFDPSSSESITAAIRAVLENNEFAEDLKLHSLRQATKFSWHRCAERAIAAWESLTKQATQTSSDTVYRPRSTMRQLAEIHRSSNAGEQLQAAHFLARNESAGSLRQLFVDVSELSQRDAATGVQRVVRGYLNWLLKAPPEGFCVEPVYAASTGGYRYATEFLQHFTGSASGSAVDTPIRWQRGDIFFALDMQHHAQIANQAFLARLMREGVTVKFMVYDLLPIEMPEAFKDSGATLLHEQLLKVVAMTDGAICISRATADAFRAWIDAQHIPTSPSFGLEWAHIGGDPEGSVPSQGIPDDARAVDEATSQRPTFLCVSTIEPRKNQRQILQAMDLLWSSGTDANILFVGSPGWKVDTLLEQITSHPELGRRLFWLRGISDEYLAKLYSSSTCVIAASSNEGFGLSLIEAARYGCPVLARDIPVFREIAADNACYFSGDSGADLAGALGDWLSAYARHEHIRSDQLRWLSWQESTAKISNLLLKDRQPRKQLLIDISSLVHHDAKTGIQRVVRNVIREWMENPPSGHALKLVYATGQQSYRYAENYTNHLLDQTATGLTDPPIDIAPGDVFFGLDLHHHVPIVHYQYLKSLQEYGVSVWFMVYDLLPIQFPSYWEPQFNVDHWATEWLKVITQFDGAICISSSVADELEQWIEHTGHPVSPEFAIEWCHLGADIDEAIPVSDAPEVGSDTLDKIESRPSLLMVGTLEPRKGHQQVLGAMDLLWQQGSDLNLIIVGKSGWLVDDLVSQIRAHPELGNRLHWLESASDQMLERLYSSCSALLAASYGEGFGLPLIEAAQRRMPIIARDIPVFREVAQRHAYYFTGLEYNDLAGHLSQWLALYLADEHPKSDAMPWGTWRQCADRLQSLLGVSDIKA